MLSDKDATSVAWRSIMRWFHLKSLALDRGRCPLNLTSGQLVRKRLTSAIDEIPEPLDVFRAIVPSTAVVWKGTRLDVEYTNQSSYLVLRHAKLHCDKVYR